MSCRHEALIADGKLSPPTSFTKVYNEECTLCFHKSTDPEGLYVCLLCFNGGCLEHARLHFEKTGHPLSALLKKTVHVDELPSKLCRVEVQPEPKETFHYEKTINCFSCEQPIDEPKLLALAEKIIQADSAKKKADVQVWKETVMACEHTLGIRQDEFSPAAIAKHASNHCNGCDLNSNVWLCLVCGAVGCGRRQFDGSGGNGHAADHFKETGHGVSVKLGTITPEGEADIFCYHCDEMRTDPQLAKHLGLFGMRVEGAERTEKSMAELQLEQNQRYDFSMRTQDGAELEAATGPGCIGIANLGNSCYAASVVQTLCALPQFARVFGDQSHFMTCSKEPAMCFQCQLTKVQLAFATGKHEKISPWMLKAVVGSGHPEFSTSQQQDAAEFFSYLVRLLQRIDPSSAALKAFEHRIRQTLTCASCGNSRHQVMDSEVFPLDLGAAVLEAEDPLDPQVSLEKCIVKALASENVNVTCSSCGHSVSKKSQCFAKLPQILVLPLSRYITENWVPRKLDLAISVPMHGLNLASFYDPSKASDAASSEIKVTVNEATIQQLTEMGFSKNKAIQALEQTGNHGAEAAMEWLFQNLETPEAEYSQAASEDPTAGLEIPEESVSILVGAGYTVAQARKALADAGLDVNAAYEALLMNPDASAGTLTFSRKAPSNNAAPSHEDNGSTLYDLEAFICHKGPSIHCGHYVAYRRDTARRWVLCNDEKLAWVSEEMAQEAAAKAYIFFYKRRTD